MQYFFIRKDSTLPLLRLSLIDDGRNTFRHFNESIQNAEVRFTMTNIDTNVKKISNAPCSIKLRGKDTCDEEYVIEYEWKKRDTNESGSFEGVFEIDFKDGVKTYDTVQPKGLLNMPIRERLLITIEP
jgi:hypothetical protein